MSDETSGCTASLGETAEVYCSATNRWFRGQVIRKDSTLWAYCPYCDVDGHVIGEADYDPTRPQPHPIPPRQPPKRCLVASFNRQMDRYEVRGAGVRPGHAWTLAPIATALRVIMRRNGTIILWRYY